MTLTFYSFARSLVAIGLKPVYRIETIGKENIPAQGSVLLCANHINNLDPLLVGITSSRPVHFMAKDELFSVPLLGKIVRNLNAFPVKRGMSDREALRTGLAILKEDKVLGLFPEGTRSKTGEIGKGLAGAGFFALRSEAQIVPCAIIGPYKAFNKIKVVYGQPLKLEIPSGGKLNAEQATDLIMTEIQKLIIQYK